MLRSLALVLLFATLCACSEADESSGPNPVPEPSLPQGLSDGWNEFLPGGETSCALGGEYAFYVRPGTVNKVIVEFIGGGACWNAFTCGANSASGAICTQTVDGVRAAVNANMPVGFYDQSNPDNPFAGWYHVVVPYCSCDVHWGNNVANYPAAGGGEFTVTHRGAVNTGAVLDWLYTNFSAPEDILVTGCSAGSYGSVMWSGHIAEHYESSRVIQFGDSGAGIITQDFFEQSFPSWNAEPAFPSWIEGLDLSKINLLDLALSDLYIGLQNHYPQHHFSQYNTNLDENQTFYYVTMGGKDAMEWSMKMHGSIDAIEAEAPAFSHFIAPGEQHCILGFDNFYTVNVDGRRLVDWLADMVADREAGDAACSGTACDAATP